MQTPNLAKDKRKLTVSIHIGGERVETLTEEQRNRIAEKLSKAMSLYYSNHPEEYLKI